MTAVTLNNTPAAGSLGTTSCTGTYTGYTPAVGDLLVAVVLQANSAAKINQPSFTNAQGWTNVLDTTNGGAGAGSGFAAASIWVLQAAGGDAAPVFSESSASGGTQTHSCVVAAVCALGGVDLSNFTNASYLDTSGSYHSGTSSATLSAMSASTAAVPSATGGLAVSGFAQERAADTVTWTDSVSPAFTADTGGNGASNELGTYAGHYVNPSTSAVTTDSGHFSTDTTAYGAGVLVVFKAAAAATTAHAGLASGAGTAQPPATATTANASLASGTGTAPDGSPAVTAAASLASGTGAAQDAAVTAAGGTTVSAGLATAAGTAQQPGPGVTASAGLAAAAADSPIGLSGTAVPAAAAQAASAAQQPVPAIAAAAGLASGTGAANAPNAALAANAGQASGTGTAQGPSVTTSGSTAAPAGLASGTGTALPPAIAESAAAGLAAGTGTSWPPLPSAGASAALAAGTGTSWPAAAAVTANAGTAAGTGAALQPSVTTSGSATAGLATASGTAQQPSVAESAAAGLASGTGTAQQASASTGGGTPVSSADAGRAVESAFWYVSGAPDTASATDSAASVRVSSADPARVATDSAQSAWPGSHDAARAADVPLSAWPAGDEVARAAEGWLPFRFALSDSAHALEVLHEMGIWTYLPVNVRLAGRFWLVTGLDEQGSEVIVLQAEQLDGAVLELAERVRLSRARLVSSGDSADAAERAGELVAVTCWVQPAVVVSVAVTAAADSPIGLSGTAGQVVLWPSPGSMPSASTSIPPAGRSPSRPVPASPPAT